MQGPLNLEYVGPDGLGACLQAHEGRVLGVVGFGACPVPDDLRQPPPLWVPIPVLGGASACYEVWTSDSSVTPCGDGNITARVGGGLLFGHMQLEQPAGVSFEDLTRQAYLELFSFLERQPCRHLLRVWNYLPRINEAENGQERYRCFNAGRHAAFVERGREIDAEHVPAASVLGCESGPMVIYFLAAIAPGKAIDNPRQLAAYRYPEQYGSRSPIFARAMLADFGARQCLILSGTASIVGHETMHKGDVERQALEAMHNVRTLLERAYPADSADDTTARTLLKVYVRHTADTDRAKRHIEHAFGPGQQTVFLQSDVCRTDLLVEVEGCQFRAVEP